MLLMVFGHSGTVILGQAGGYAVPVTEQPRFEEWLNRLRALAAARDLGWAIDPSGETHQTGYEKGLAPEEELQSLADMSEWRGCGCGGA